MKLVVDSSALVAILLVEPDAVQVAIKLATASECVMSTNSYLETALVIVSRGIALKHLDDLIKKSRIKRIGSCRMVGQKKPLAYLKIEQPFLCRGE